jgi:tRNA modification GTPase
MCSWQELERETTGTILEAKAITALAEALTPRTAAILLDQVHGAFARALDEILSALDRGDLDAAATRLTELNCHASLGQHLTKPWRVAIGGAPNVGKSSLLNAIAGYERCIVAPTPGTTRDVVTTIVALDGWPVELADTAGLRGDAEPVEAAGIDHARATLAAAELRLWLFDASTTPLGPTADIGPAQLIINKIDLAPAWDLDSATDALRVSALTGAGIADMCTALAKRLVPEPLPAGSAIPFTERLCGLVKNALQHLAIGDVGTTVSTLQSCLTSD